MQIQFSISIKSNFEITIFFNANIRKPKSFFCQPHFLIICFVLNDNVFSLFCGLCLVNLKLAFNFYFKRLVASIKFG